MDSLPSIHIRPIRPDDTVRLKALLGELSPETRYMRFHQIVHDFTPEQWRYLTCVDGRDHVALVACAGDRIVGVSRYIRDRERPDVAEVAFVVSDRFQRRGVGRTLRDRLVAVARDNGIRSFVAVVKPQNTRIRKLMSGGGLTLLSARFDLLEASLVGCESAAE